MAKAKGTKAIASRIPYESYIELLDDAQRRGMTMNEYVAWRVFSKVNYEEKIKLLEKENEKLKGEIKKVASRFEMVMVYLEGIRDCKYGVVYEDVKSLLEE